MAKKKRKTNFNLEKIFKKKPPKAIRYVLEHGTLAQMRQIKNWTQDLLDYHWWFYSELAGQRDKNIEKIKEVLISSCASDFTFTNWQRAVKYQYSLHPLCTIGSTRFIGGRFNYGEDINSNISPFHCLYVAIDKETALQETLGQEPSPDPRLTPLEVALINPNSTTVVSVSGKLDKIFDLRKSSSLRKLQKIFATFKLSNSLIEKAKSLKQAKPAIIATEKLLKDSILDKNWRDRPTNLDVPSNSQIFGYLISISGIDGVIYSSKFSGKDCLAIFPRNFDHGDSFIQIDDPTPIENVPNRIDANVWRLSELSFEEINKFSSIVH